jgi:uncharacterized protein
MLTAIDKDPWLGVTRASQRAQTRLRLVLESCQPGVLAVSGGIDSRVLWAAATKWGLDLLPVYLSGVQMSKDDLDWAKASRPQGLTILALDLLCHPAVLNNQPKRCYYCKKKMSLALKSLAARLGRPWVLEGSNASDLLTYRPGRQALQELGIKSPLAEARLKKAHIRALARLWGLKRPDQTTSACLLTRLAYGCRVDKGLLRKIDALERRLSSMGLKGFRVRMQKDRTFVLQITPGQAELVAWYWERIAVLFEAGGLLPWQSELTSQLSGYFDH